MWARAKPTKAGILHRVHLPNTTHIYGHFFPVSKKSPPKRQGPFLKIFLDFSTCSKTTSTSSPHFLLSEATFTYFHTNSPPKPCNRSSPPINPSAKRLTPEVLASLLFGPEPSHASVFAPLRSQALICRPRATRANEEEFGDLASEGGWVQGFLVGFPWFLVFPKNVKGRWFYVLLIWGLWRFLLECFCVKLPWNFHTFDDF